MREERASMRAIEGAPLVSQEIPRGIIRASFRANLKRRSILTIRGLVTPTCFIRDGAINASVRTDNREPAIPIAAQEPEFCNPTCEAVTSSNRSGDVRWTSSLTRTKRKAPIPTNLFAERMQVASGHARESRISTSRSSIKIRFFRPTANGPFDSVRVKL
jgi:hypothetical protein